MIVALVIWGYMIALCYIYGLGSIKFLQKILQSNFDTTLPFPIIVIVGMAIITTLASYLSLVIPISELASFILLAGAVLILILERTIISFQIQPRPFLVWSIIIISSLVILGYSTGAPLNPDTALYHAQVIRWTETYRVVPGLANLNYRLAENSSWMILNAAFSFSFLRIQSFHLADSLILLIAAWYFIDGLQNILNRQITFSAITKILLLFFSLYIYVSDAPSPSADLPASLLTWVIMAMLIEKLETDNLKFDLYSISILVLSIFAITIKLATLPLVAISCLILIQAIGERKYARGLMLVCSGMFILLPWLVRNVYLSGYLVFPVSQIDLFSFDWKYPKSLMDANRNAIVAAARYPTSHFADAIGLPLTQWVPLWIENLTKTQKAFIFAAILFPILSLLTLRIGKANYGIPKLIELPLIINIAGLFFWFLTAPSLRFGFGFIVALIAMGVAQCFLILLKSNVQISVIFLVACTFLSLLYQGYAYIRSTSLSDIAEQLIIPADYLPSRAEPCPLQNGTVYCRRNGYQCNYDSFPCIPSPRPQVAMRGSSYADGFRYSP